MSDVIIPYEFLCRGGTAAALASWNGVPRTRQLIVETDTGRMKLGDGSTAYNDLPYTNVGKIDFSGISDGKVPMWSASNSRFEIKSITADGVEYTAGSSSSLAADNVAEALDELSAKVDEKIGDAPIDGNTYGRKNGAWAVAGGGGGGGGMTLVGSDTVAGSAATDMTVSGLDLVADGPYIIYINLGNATAGAASISLLYNADAVATNYYTQFSVASGASLNAARNNSAVLATMNASSAITGTIDLLADLSGYPRATMRLNRNAPSASELVSNAHVRNNTANVTSITISSSVASTLAIGSYIKVFKVG